MDDLERELNTDFSLNDNAVQNPPPLPPKEKKVACCRNRTTNYSPPRVKVRNFLTNVAHNRVKDEDFNSKLFVVNCYTFLLLYLNPFYLKQKFEAALDRDYVETICYSVMPNDFYTFVCRPDNCATLNKLKLRFQDTFDIVKSYVNNANSFIQL